MIDTQQIKPMKSINNHQGMESAHPLRPLAGGTATFYMNLRNPHWRSWER